MSPSAGTLRVAVLAGGRSSEHEVSLSSAAAVRDGLIEAGHETVWVELARDGSWCVDGRPIDVTPGGGLLDADVVFGALHGPFGEDGSVQGLLEMLDVPYVGAGVPASAVCIDKVLFKRLMATAGMPQVAYVGLSAERWQAHPDAALAEIESLGLPVFVKPAHLGSSVGISKASSAQELRRAIGSAFEYDELVIVEAASTGLEVECGVLGVLGSERAQAFASEPGEITFASEFYDYDAKYAPEGMGLLVPARISPAAREQVMALALATFELVRCDGLARVDFFVEGEEVLVNELNTMPGFTPTSVYAKLLDASGVGYTELVDRLCRLALARHRELAGYRR
jgi:D-alanine-D-alanine ligase